MKRLMVVLAALGIFGVTPVLANEHSHMMMDTPEGLRQCAAQAESIQERIKRLETEINKGTKVYSAEHLQKLEDKLKEANKILDDLEKPGR